MTDAAGAERDAVREALEPSDVLLVCTRYFQGHATFDDAITAILKYGDARAAHSAPPAGPREEATNFTLRGFDGELTTLRAVAEHIEGNLTSIAEELDKDTPLGLWTAIHNARYILAALHRAAGDGEVTR